MKHLTVNTKCHNKYLVMSKHRMSHFSQFSKPMSQTKERWRIFGAYIKTERENANLSQEGLGDLISRDRQTIYRIENAIGGTTYETVVELAKAMNLDKKSTLNKAGFDIPDEEPIENNSYEIFDGIYINFENGKKVPKGKRDELINIAKTIARGVMTEADK